MFRSRGMASCWSRTKCIKTLPHVPMEEAAPGQCHRCGVQCGRNITIHRGSDLANRTCVKCGRVYASWDSVRSHKRGGFEQTRMGLGLGWGTLTGGCRMF